MIDVCYTVARAPASSRGRGGESIAGFAPTGMSGVNMVQAT
jgi:hypothetical protein